MTFAALNRRIVVATLDAVPLATLLHRTPTSARKKKNGKRRSKGDVNKRCKSQGAAWRDYVSSTCAGNPSCLSLLTCAEPLEVCDFTGYLTCLLTRRGEALSVRDAGG